MKVISLFMTIGIMTGLSSSVMAMGAFEDFMKKDEPGAVKQEDEKTMDSKTPTKDGSDIMDVLPLKEPEKKDEDMLDLKKPGDDKES